MTTTSDVINRIAPFEITTTMEALTLAVTMPILAYIYTHVWTASIVYTIIASSFTLSAALVLGLLWLTEIYAAVDRGDNPEFDAIFDTTIILSIIATTAIAISGLPA